MVDLFLAAFFVGLMALGMKRPFVWVLAYLYIDIVAPQKISWFLLASLPVSLIVFAAAFAGWLLIDDKRDSRFSLRQGLFVALFLYCGATTLMADFPEEAAQKWEWVWKAMVFAIFLPLTLRTRLRIEATVLVMVLAASSIIVSGGIKTALGGGGYGELRLLVNDNTGLYEGSIISTVAVAIVPLIVWLARHGTIFPPDWRVKLYAFALGFACLLMPVGTAARTGLLCIAVLGVLSLRTVRRRILYVGLMALAGVMALPFLPQSYLDRMSTIENHQSDQSASTRIAVWEWTLNYVSERPMGGGFASYLGNKLRVDITKAETTGSLTTLDTIIIEDKARAFHSSYFEMLGEQGWPGLTLWLWIQLLGIWQMERIRRKWKDRAGAHEKWQAPLACALQQTHIVYMVGSLFVGIAFQPFILMLIGVQCGLWTYLRRIDARDTGTSPLPRDRARTRNLPSAA